MTDWVTDDDWAFVWRHVQDAARAIEVEGSTATALLALTGEQNIPLVATKFHDAIVARLANDPSMGALRDPSDPDKYDLVLFGHPAEIKTGITRRIGTNKSYASKPAGPGRLVVFVNYSFRTDEIWNSDWEGNPTGGVRVYPYLLRYGFLGPGDYEYSDSATSQYARLRRDTVERLSSPRFFSESNAYHFFPAILAVPELGRATIRRLGLNGQTTVMEYSRYDSSGDWGLYEVADKFEWGTAGCDPEPIRWGDL